MQDAYMGIDPGKTGAISVLEHRDRTSAPTVALLQPLANLTDKDIWEAINGAALSFNIAACLIEKVHAGIFANPKKAGHSMGVTSAFTFGEGYGKLKMAIVAAGIPHDFVAPASWQRELKCLTKGDKKISRDKAQRFFPDQKVTLQTADALLIALFCSRKERGLC